ncbi:hypothetical protein [Paractinoplanes rishiriensis]|uniref:Uncharacterized protein n=1 Tax=Paractinoplanes rishiriensis TaxID=1050105 RepID=A0A919KB59_9ACTN|nr:hypothetical protein [Actinoplanes rishiriensis]GIF02251.1 hypothetical protein Ari01nite_97150 [Actinoplanes rishiriensis]
MTTPADWTFLDHDDVTRAAYRAARRVANQYPAIADTDDLYHDALILLANNPDQIHTHHDDMRVLHHWLWCRLVDTIRPQARQANLTISYERAILENAA